MVFKIDQCKFKESSLRVYVRLQNVISESKVYLRLINLKKFNLFENKNEAKGSKGLAMILYN